MGRRRHSHDLRVRVAGQAFVNKMMVRGGLKLNRLRWQVMWRSTLEEMTPIFYSYKSENDENRVLPLYHQPAIWPNPRVLYCEYSSVFACALPLWWERQNDKSNTTQEHRRLMQITNRAHLERFPASELPHVSLFHTQQTAKTVSGSPIALWNCWWKNCQLTLFC